jgi:hypothetical protein
MKAYQEPQDGINQCTIQRRCIFLNSIPSVPASKQTYIQPMAKLINKPNLFFRKEN